MNKQVIVVIAAIGLTVLAGPLAGVEAQQQAGVKFLVEQAQAKWMPNRSNLRWEKDLLQSLFFFTVESDKELKGLSLQVATKDKTMKFLIDDVSPITAELKKTIKEAKQALYDERLDTAVKSRVDETNWCSQYQVEDSRKTVKEIWLPVRPEETIKFSLYQGRKLLAEEQRKITVEDALWWRLEARASKKLDPLDYSYALLPENKVLAGKGDAIDVEIPIVGLDPKIKNVTLELKAGSYYTKENLEVIYLKRRIWTGKISTKNFKTGRYPLSAVLKAGEGDDLAELTRIEKELILVESKTIVRRFGATYTDLRYDEPVIVGQRDNTVSWDSILPHFGPLQDIVVGFEQKPYKIIFWRGASYVPMLVVDNYYFSWEWIEGGPGEPIQDKDVRYGRVKIISSNPARAVVHWRYPQSRRYPEYIISDDEWGDEYFYIYPDMVAVRKIMGWFGKDKWHETNEFINVFPPGMHPREVFELPNSFTIMDLEGKRLDLSYPNPWKNWDRRWPSFIKGKNSFVFKVNVKDRPDPFVSIKYLMRIYALFKSEHRAYLPGVGKVDPRQVGVKEAPYGGWRHWPVTRIEDAPVSEPWQYEAGPAHWCLFDMEHRPVGVKELGNNRQLKVWAHLLGLDAEVDSLEITNSWLEPAEIKSEKGLEYLNYDITQRAYLFKNPGSAREFAFTFTPQEGVAQVNPAFVIDEVADEAKVDIQLNGKTIGPKEIRYGFEPKSNGFYDLVTWLDRNIKTKTRISIQLSAI